MKTLALILGALLAQPLLPQAPAAKPAAEAETVRVVGIRASREGSSKLQIDSDLKPYKKVFESLEGLDTFRLLSAEEKPAPHGEETEFVITGRYRMYVRPSGQSESGNLAIDARIEMDTPGGPVDALRARGEAQPNRALIFNGMELDADELVVIMTLLPPEGSDEQQSEDQEQDAESDEEQEQEQEPQEPEEDNSASESEAQEPEEMEAEQEPETPEGESEEDTPQPEDDTQEGESETPPPQAGDAEESPEMPDLDTIDALLESLEETDQQEQRNAHNRDRKPPRISGEWW